MMVYTTFRLINKNTRNELYAYHFVTMQFAQ